jgi:hypothetical protein
MQQATTTQNLNTQVEDGRKLVSEWVQRDKSAKDKLYEALAHAYELYQQARSTDQILSELKEKANRERLKINKRTPDMLVVHLLFKEVDHHSHSIYATTLRKADENGVTPTGMPAWLKENGGPNQIRRWKDNSGESPKKGDNSGNKTGLARLKDNLDDFLRDGAMAHLSAKATSMEEGKVVVPVGRVGADGTIHVIGFITEVDEKLAERLSQRLGRDVGLVKASDDAGEGSTDQPDDPNSNAGQEDEDVTNIQNKMKKVA